jgi:ABC-type nitrate/sulfonate/bicarbonate transport system substrate-binding protein
MKRFIAGTASCPVILVVLLFSSFCAAAAEPKKFTFGYSSVGPMMHGLWMAKETGAFEKHGLEADLIFIPSGPIVVQALLGGDLHAGLAATSAVVAATLKERCFYWSCGEHRQFAVPQALGHP